MKSNIFILHGTAGHPQENWFPWLKEKLEAKGLEVFVPQFPTPEGQSFQAWLDVLEPHRKMINQDTILIGHSLGALFLLRLLEKLERPVKAAVFVAGVVGVKPIGNYGELERFSKGFEFDWEKIKSNSKNFIVYHSDTDPYLPLKNGEELAKNLGVKLSFIPNAGHFNAKAGYLTFEDLYKKLENIL